MNNKTMFYGRARRLDLAKKVGIVAGIILILVLIIIFVTKKVDFVDHNVNFAYMKQYFYNKGYTCEQIDKDGGKCFLKGDNTYYSFTRYSIGFEYLVRSEGYTLQFRHVLNTFNDITFTTTNNALSGVKNKVFTCYTKDNINGEFDYCETSDKERLDSSTYIGVIKSAIADINSIIDASGYDKKTLIDEYVWEK